MTKIKGERVATIHHAVPADVRQLREYLKGNWGKTRIPKIVKRWDVNLDQDFETLELNGPIIDLHKLKKALDKQGIQTILTVDNKGATKLLLKFRKVQGSYEKNSAGIIFPDYVEMSMDVPALERKKVLRMLPDFLIKTR
ncbi:MAG TPA: hypothetical protein VGQ00_02730 [Candidatus Norongarragalinales archaeon]|jgi:hypothetical protein|nr:hypothetical protein [Candidatus Norongarragalinales archaeon]